jgi:hypothetical protein
MTATGRVWPARGPSSRSRGLKPCRTGTLLIVVESETAHLYVFHLMGRVTGGTRYIPIASR